MKKAFRDIKRGVNKKVLKVPSIEQKVLDATSNDPWGPHGTYLGDIAQASKNYHEYQMIMSVVWKRLSDSGKNWRHVYKGLTVLEYLIANGSERVIEDIREHAYQIEALSSFQYIDSTGRDQGSNIRMKSQSIVALVNDKDKIQEAREKAAANRDKLRSTSSGDYGNGYGDEKYGYKNDGRSESSERERAYEDHSSSRDSNARAEDASPDLRLEPKSSSGAPPSYEDALTEGQSPTTNHQETTNSVAPATTAPPPAATAPPVTAKEDDFFDPRGEPPAAPSGVAEVDLFGSLSDSFSSEALALVPSEPPTNPNPSQAFVSASPVTQAFDDPFGDGPFRAIPSTVEVPVQVQPLTTPFGEPLQSVATTPENDIEFVDILADILPPTGPPPSHTLFQPQTGQFHSQNGYAPQPTFSSTSPGPFGQPSPQNGHGPQPNEITFSSGPFGQPSQNGYAQETTFSSTSAPQPNEITFSSSSAGQPSPQNGHGPQPNEITFPSSSAAPQNGYTPQPKETTFSAGPFGQPPPPNGYAPETTFSSSSAAPFDQPSPQNGYAPETTFSSNSPGPFDQPSPQTPQPNDPFSQTDFSAQSNQTPISSSLPSPFSQPMPQPSFPAQGGQSVLPPSFPSQGTQSGFPAQDGQSSGFLAHGGQPVLQPPFSAQGNQSVLQPAAQGGQSLLPSSFPAQGGQPVSQPAFSVQGNQSTFPAAQGGQSISPPGFPAQGGQPSSQPSLPAAQGGQSILPSGFPAQGGQPASQPSFPAAQGGHSVLPFGFPAQGGQPASQPSFPAAQGGQLGPQYGFPAQGSQPVSQASFLAAQGGQLGSQYGFPARSGQSLSQPGFAGGLNASLGGFSSQLGTAPQAGFPNSNGQHSQPNNFYGGFQPQSSSAPVPSLTQVNTTPGPQYTNSNFYQPPAVTSSTGALSIVPQQPTNVKFETKSTVWADTLNRGLVNLNISGSKTNPLSDIGIDFEAMNRKEKRLEKPSKSAVTSNVSMGKAMGSGSGMGRAGAGALRPAPNPMGMGITPGYGGMNNMPQNMGSGMNIGQGFQQPPVNYNPMMGRGGGYGQQLPYGGYR